ncbi:MAG: endonuclease MutS2 [Cyclobacteriaceae bacterium]
MLYPVTLEDKIGFDQIRQLLKDACTSSLGTYYVDKIQFSENFDHIHKLLHQTDEFRLMLQEGTAFPSGNYLDVRPQLSKAKTPGIFLSEEEFHQIQLSLDTIVRCITFFEDPDNQEAYPHLFRLSQYVARPSKLLGQIQQIIDEKGHIRNNASKELQDTRRSMLSEQSRLRKVLDQILRQARQQGYTADDATITIRGGRMVIPIQAEYKRRVKGFVHDESATGHTVFLEPAEVLEVNNEIRDLEYRERREITKILVGLTDQVRPHLQELRTAYQFLGMMDFIRAKARLAVQLKAVLPTLEKKRLIQWEEARHPLLQLSHQAQDKPIVPLTIELQSDQRILVISGPNAGGKSICLKTVALVQYMLQCGLLPPMSERSTTGIFQSIFIDIGDEQSLENDLSTYSSHLTNMNYFAKFADQKTLVLIDEFGTGTEPQFGGAIAEAILEDLNGKKVFGVITTHYANLKEFANRAEGVVNGAMRFDTDLLEPLYQLDIGKPGSSFALEIARKIGLQPSILDQAKELAGIEHVQYEKLLSELENEKNKFQQLTQELAAKEKRISSTSKEYEELREHLKNERKRILADAKREASQLLQDTNQKIEHTIRVIKEQKAEKEVTRQARQELEDWKKQVKPKPAKPKPRRATPVTREEGVIQKGDAVRVVENGALGEVISLRNNQAEILIGSLKSTVKLNRLEKVAKQALKKVRSEASVTRTPNINLNEKRANFNSSLDIRGNRVEEVIPKLEAWVDEASMFGSSELRIVHGKGNGILREVVRNYLREHPSVSSFQEEHIERGGAGVTLAYLR